MKKMIRIIHSNSIWVKHGLLTSCFKRYPNHYQTPSFKVFETGDILFQVRFRAIRLPGVKCISGKRPVYVANNVGFGKYFHTSSRRYIPAFLLVLVTSIAKVGAAVTAGIVRLLYRRLKEDERTQVVKKLKKYWYLLIGSFSSLGLSGTSYYNYCMEKTPITGRKRFMPFNKQQREDMASAQSEMLRKHVKLHRELIYKKTHPKHVRVQQVADKLLTANPEELKHIEQFQVFVTKDPILNAHVLHDGHIFVSARLLKLADTPDQLAMLLGHELAHALLDHGIEKLNNGSIAEDIIIAALGLLGYILPKGELSKYLRGKVVRMQVQRPYTAVMEEEADVVGMRFAANACYDIREGVVLWRKMAEYQKSSEPSEANPDWTWTHPDSLERAAHIENTLDQGEQWRREMKCPELPATDPRMAKIRNPLADKHQWYKGITGSHVPKEKAD